MKRLGLRLAPAAVAAVLASASAGALIWTGPAAAAETITVCASGCQYTTIQEAINHASNGARIQIAAGTYSGFIDRSVNVTLEGAGAGKTIISGGGTGTVVRIRTHLSVAISGVTITDGNENLFGGGGIATEGMLTLTNSSVSGNTAVFGGGIEIAPFGGTLTLTNSTVSGNHASSVGGGIEAEGPVTLNTSTVSGNTAGRFGGGIWEQETFVPSGEVTLNNSTVSGNTAAEEGGGIDNFGGTATLNNSAVIQNSTGEFGGGIANSATLKLAGSHVSENTATRSGGGIYNEGTATLENSAVTHNTARERGGGIFNQKVFGETPATVTLVNSLVRLNSPDNCFGTVC